MNLLLKTLALRSFQISQVIRVIAVCIHLYMRGRWGGGQVVPVLQDGGLGSCEALGDSGAVEPKGGLSPYPLGEAAFEEHVSSSLRLTSAKLAYGLVRPAPDG